MTIQAAKTEVGWALQSAEATPATNPTYVIRGLFSPSLPEPSQDVLQRTPAMQRGTVATALKAMQSWQADIAVPITPLSAGPLIKGLLPTENVSGSYDHAFTPGTTDYWLSLFDLRPGALYERYSDGIVESLTVEFKSGEPAELTAVLVGKTSEVVGAYTPGTIENTGRTDDWLTYVGATVKLDVASSPASTNVTANVEGGSIKLERTAEVVGTADTSTPLGVRRGLYTLEVSLDTTWQDYTAFRAWFYGSTSGSTPSTTLVYGSLQLVLNARFTANRSLTIDIPKLLLQPAPTQPANSALLDQQLSGTGIHGASALTTWTLRNNKSGAY